MIKKCLVFLIIIHSVIAQKSTPKDTLKTEVLKNLVYVIHKVEKSQTLYSLLKKYETSFNEAIALNPALKTTTVLSPGQILKFPLKKDGKHLSLYAYTKAKNEEKKNSKTNILQKKESVKSKYHVIKAGDTIFSIAKFYSINISDLVEANNISDNKIKIGAQLLVDKAEIEKVLSVLEKSKNPVLELKTEGKRVLEEGIAQVINTNNRTTKYLALHRKAKIGSVIKVTNEANGISITAKVVGNLSAFGHDQETMIKLSPYAFYKLGPRDSKIRAKVEYYISHKK